MLRMNVGSEESLGGERFSDEGPASQERSPVNDGLEKLNPVVKTYLYPSDMWSFKRYFQLVFAIWGLLLVVLGPLSQVFIVQPLVNLLLFENGVVTPNYPCFDPRKISQTCDQDVNIDYYFWNITNKDEWIQGVSQPKFQEIGPYSFKSKEVRYNMSYSSDWNEVEYTYHQWAEFDPKKSCKSCSLNDSLITVNRGYLQFLSASQGGPLDAESLVAFQLLPSSFRFTLDIIRGYMDSIFGVAQSEEVNTLAQWARCETLESLQSMYNFNSPFIKDFIIPGGSQQLSFHPEFCHFVVETIQTMHNITILPAQMALYGVNMTNEKAMAFLALAVGSSNVTFSDPASQSFLLTFTTMPRDSVLQYFGMTNPGIASGLALIDQTEWSLLQGYALYIMNKAGKILFQEFLRNSGGGLILQKTLEEWLYGFEDPILLLGAQAAAIQRGEPDSYKLRPWEFTPSLALTFSSMDYPTEYLRAVTNHSISIQDLSWNRSDIGNFLPLVQQKRMSTGKSKSARGQNIYEYRGLPFVNATWGILNNTGSNEGISYGGPVLASTSWLTFDSALARPIRVEYSRNDTKVKGIDSMIFTMSSPSLKKCNWTLYEEWADKKNFSASAFQEVMNTMPEELYNSLNSNDRLFSEYLKLSLLGEDLEYFFGKQDPSRDRCMTPDLADAVWDMSGAFACPTFYSFPRFHQISPETLQMTGYTEWNSSHTEHSYGLAVEPLTGISVKGHKTYQVNHLVTKTSLLYPTLWTVNGSSETTGMQMDIVAVPVFWIRMWWEPKDADAFLLRSIKSMISYLYTILVIGWPSMGGFMLISSLIQLLYSRDAKKRSRILKEVQEDKAKPLKIPKSQRKKLHTIYMAHHQQIAENVGPICEHILHAINEAYDEDYSSEEEAIENSYMSIHGAHVL